MYSEMHLEQTSSYNAALKVRMIALPRSTVTLTADFFLGYPFAITHQSMSIHDDPYLPLRLFMCSLLK
jgi:hypothetical protein